MSSASSSMISDLISPLKSAVAPQLYARVEEDLSLRESRHASEKNLLQQQIRRISGDNAVLDKDLRHVKRDYGELLLQNSDISREKLELQRELGGLKASLHAAEVQAARLRADQESKTRDYDDLVRRNGALLRELAETRLELKQLKASSADVCAELEKMRDDNEQARKNGEATAALEREVRVYKDKLGDMTAEVVELREEKKKLRGKAETLAAVEAELRVCKGEREVLVGKVKQLEWKGRRLAEDAADVDKLKGENEELKEKNGKLKRAYDAVEDAANSKLRRFSDRVSVLERIVAGLNVSLGVSGEQRVGVAHVEEPLESLGSDAKPEVLVGIQSVYGATPGEGNSASSLPCRQRVSTGLQGFGSDARPEVLLKCETVRETMPSDAEKTASSKQFTVKYPSANTPICISDSDDDAEPKGLKRKLVFSDVSEHSKAPMTSLRQCEQKVSEALLKNPHIMAAESHADVEVESGMSMKQWQYEADMIDDLGKDTELCMKAICALYRLHTTVDKSRGFSAIDAFRGMVLGKFLADGNAEGGLKKSLVELMEYDFEGASKCRRIAIAHSSRLFNIYKNKEDPNFASPNY